MAGVRWQIRRTDTYNIVDGMWPQEPLFHTGDNRFGVMSDIYLSWFPYIEDDAMRLPTKWTLTGNAGFDRRYMEAVWDIPATFLFRPVHPTHPYFETTDGPLAPIITMSAASQTMTAGPDERLNHGYANSLENFEIAARDMDYSIPLTKTSKTSDISQVSGNGFLWISGASTNFNITVQDNGSIDNSGAIKNNGVQDQTWQAKGKNAIGFQIAMPSSSFSNSGRGIGYRSFVFQPDAVNKKLTFSCVINDYHINGGRFSTRIGQPGYWQQVQSVLSGNGQQHLVFYYDPLLMHGDKTKPLCIDWLFDWYYDTSVYNGAGQLVKLELACMTVHDGWIKPENLNPAFHAYTQDNGYADLYGFSSKKEYAYSPIGTVTFKKPLLQDNYRLALTSQKKMVALEKSRYGFVYQATDAVADEAWSFTYSAKVVGDLSDIV